MSGGDDKDDDKPYEASQKRLDDARKKGEVPHSTDLTAAGSLAGLLFAAMAFGPDLIQRMGAALTRLVRDASGLSEVMFTGGAGSAAMTPILSAVALPLAGWMLPPAIAAMIVILVQNAFVISLERIKPKGNRLDPISGAKNKFGRNGLFEFGKSSVKLVLISVVLAVFVVRELPGIMTTMALDPNQAITLLLALSVKFIGIVFVMTFVIGAVDVMWQRAEHARKHRMSHKEMTDEHKESEGDPHLKGRRRQRGIEIAMNQMMADVPNADVVIVNPTHYAVALKWEREKGSAPVCVAKGVDAVALRIREKAMEAGVPVRSDPPTARALHRIVEVGQEIPPDQYRAVAVAIRFADRMRAKAKSGFGLRNAR